MALKGPGLRLIIPFGIDRLVKIDLRTVTLEVPPQESSPSTTSPSRSRRHLFPGCGSPQRGHRVANFINATSQIAQTTLRSVLGQSSLDELLANREKITPGCSTSSTSKPSPGASRCRPSKSRMSSSRRRCSAPWPSSRGRAEKRAKIIHAEGEFEAAQKLTDAAGVIATQPSALQLRYLQP